MKAPNIRYMRPRSLHEACAVLADSGVDAMPIAGGQSLLAALNLRLASPELLVDIGELPELAVSSFMPREIRLGALTRHVEVLNSKPLKHAIPLLPRAASFVGHPAIRNRGTLGGSLAFADPAAELPACTVALDATIVVSGPDGERDISAEEFFTGLMQTSLLPGELIVGVRFKPAAADTRYGFVELSRRHGDFAVAGIAVQAQVARGTVTDARVVYFGCVERAAIARNVSSAMTGLDVSSRDVERVIAAVVDDLSPDDTPGWRADTKLKLAQTLTRRALQQLAGAAA
jgi:aerobic carbon-monoxide dehydrogenase medium subunit